MWVAHGRLVSLLLFTCPIGKVLYYVYQGIVLDYTNLLLSAVDIDILVYESRVASLCPLFKSSMKVTAIN